MTEHKLADIIDRLNLGVPTGNRDACYILQQQLHTLAETGVDEPFGPILRQWSVARIAQALDAVKTQRLAVPSSVLQAAEFAIKWNPISKN